MYFSVQTKQLFLEGSIQDNPSDRYKFCKKIFEIIKPLIPQDGEVELGQNLLPDSIGGQDSHGNGQNSIGGKERKGRTQAVTTRLFADLDGSGSMAGDRRNSAMISSVILHEVLKKQGIEHAIVEHRGNKKIDNEIDINILVDFNAREEEKLNIMQLDAASDNRDGVALYWAEKYINQKTFCDNKLIIVLSDGQPAHTYGEYCE